MLPNMEVTKKFIRPFFCNFIACWGPKLQSGSPWTLCSKGFQFVEIAYFWGHIGISWEKSKLCIIIQGWRSIFLFRHILLAYCTPSKSWKTCLKLPWPYDTIQLTNLPQRRSSICLSKWKGAEHIVNNFDSQSPYELLYSKRAEHVALQDMLLE